MIIEGKITHAECGRSFEFGDPKKTMYEHFITIIDDQSVETNGKYISVSEEQKSFVYGQRAKVEVEIKTDGRGKPFNKFKVVKENTYGGGGFKGGKKDYNDPVVNAQIERMTALAAALELNHTFPIEVGKYSRALAQFVSDCAKSNGGTKQASITAQSSMKSAIQAFASPHNMDLGMPLAPPTVDMIIEKALQFQKFIVNG